MHTTPLGLRFSATDLATFVACEHATWLDGQVALGLLAPPKAAPDPMLALLLERGKEHERAYLARLEASGWNVARIPYQPNDPSGAVAATREALKAGADYVYQAVFEQDGWLGIADFLEKVDRPSKLGAWSYEVADTKLGRTAKAEYLLQLALYSDLLAGVQGVAPESMHVILAGLLRETFKVADYAAYVRAVRTRLAVAARLPAGPYPLPVEHCERCAWSARCAARWLADDHLSGVANIQRRQVRRLEQAGITTMAALAASDPARKVEKIAADTFATLAQQARLQVEQRTSGKPVFELLPPSPGRGFSLLPTPAAGDVFFDMEGDPHVDAGREYLFGWETDGAYTALWGHDDAAEKKAFEAFIDFLTARKAAFPDMHVYHYAAYEPTALKRLAGRHGTREDALDQLLRAELFVDLYRIVRQGLRAGFSGYSIKDLEPFYMGPRAADVKDAASSIVVYEQWLQTGDDTLLEAIRAYNEEDCVSTRKLRDWLVPRALEARKKFGDFDLSRLPLFEPAPKDPARAEEKRLEAERLAAETAALAQGLVDGADLLDAHWRWLLAQLLDYHQREARPVWWAYFDRVRMLPEQLIEDSEAIGGLTLDETVEPRPEKRSLVYTLRFPAQDFKKNALGDARDQEGNGAGDVVDAWLDAAGGHLTLKRGPSFANKPMPSALIPGQPIATNAQRGALRRLARSVVAGDGRYRVLRALLRGDTPRVLGLLSSTLGS